MKNKHSAIVGITSLPQTQTDSLLWSEVSNLTMTENSTYRRHWLSEQSCLSKCALAHYADRNYESAACECKAFHTVPRLIGVSRKNRHPSEVRIKYSNFVLLAAGCISNWLESLSGPWQESSPWPVRFSSHSLWIVVAFLGRHWEQVWSSSQWSFFVCGRVRTPCRCAWANISMSLGGFKADRVAQHPSLIHYLFQLKVLSKGFFLFFFLPTQTLPFIILALTLPLPGQRSTWQCECAHRFICACGCMHTCACWCQLWYNDRLTEGATTPPQASRKALHSWAASCESEHRLQVKTRSREPPLF